MCLIVELDTEILSYIKISVKMYKRLKVCVFNYFSHNMCCHLMFIFFKFDQLLCSINVQVALNFQLVVGPYSLWAACESVMVKDTFSVHSIPIISYMQVRYPANKRNYLL